MFSHMFPISIDHIFKNYKLSIPNSSLIAHPSINWRWYEKSGAWFTQSFYIIKPIINILIKWDDELNNICIYAQGKTKTNSIIYNNDCVNDYKWEFVNVFFSFRNLTLWQVNVRLFFVYIKLKQCKEEKIMIIHWNFVCVKKSIDNGNVNIQFFSLFSF